MRGRRHNKVLFINKYCCIRRGAPCAVPADFGRYKLGWWGKRWKDKERNRRTIKKEYVTLRKERKRSNSCLRLWLQLKTFGTCATCRPWGQPAVATWFNSIGVDAVGYAHVVFRIFYYYNHWYIIYFFLPLHLHPRLTNCSQSSFLNPHAGSRLSDSHLFINSPYEFHVTPIRLCPSPLPRLYLIFFNHIRSSYTGRSWNLDERTSAL